MRHRRLGQPGGQLGFTLVEVLAAIALLVLLAAAVMSFLGVLRDRQRTVGDAYERQRSLSLLMERLDAEVMTCFADSGEGESGIAGSDAKLTLGSRGVGLSGNRAETLGLSSTQFSTYELSGSELKVSRLEQAGAQPMVLVVRGVGKVRFRYHDGKEWKTSFDSMNAKVLPLAIEVSVWFASTLSQAQQEPISATDSEFVEGTDAAEAGATVEIPPDRVRVFVIPDGARADRGTSDLDQTGSEPATP